MTPFVFYVAQRESQSYTAGFTIECASGPERRGAERRRSAAAVCLKPLGLSPKVKGEHFSMPLSEHNKKEKKKYLKVRLQTVLFF